MARYFQISTPEGVSSLTLDSQGAATLQVKAKNVTGAPLDSRAVLVSLPVTTPPTGAVQNGWVKIDGPAEQRFEKDQEKVIVVKVAVPKKDKPKAGTYQFRLDVGSAAVTDQGDSSQVMAFTVPETKTEPTKFPLWLIPVILVVLIGVGVGLWLLLSHSGIKVPDLQGMSVTDATTALTNAKLTLDPNLETVQSKPEDADKVISQLPSAGDKAKSGDPVHVKVGAQMVPVPMLIGHTFEEVQTLLSGKHLIAGQVSNQPNPNFAGGVVFQQSPDPGNMVLSGSAVNLSVTPKTVPVPPVVGLLVAQAVQKLDQAGLQIGTLSGDQYAQPVSAQNPAQQTPVPLGTKVDVTIPSSSFCVPIERCRIFGNAIRLMTVRPAIISSPAVALPYGPDTCKQGFVWREAAPNDHVCVLPQVRSQAAADNQQAAARRNPTGGPYGPDTCLQGYVWRDAFPNDHVCVTVDVRSQAASDNAQAASRKVQP
jgi:beta-lactam-binding protein with PASTA domain